MALTLADNLISVLDDYAEYVLSSDFSSAINQEETIKHILWVEHILWIVEQHLPTYNSKLSRNYFQANPSPSKAHKNGYRLAIREMKAQLKPPTADREHTTHLL